MERFDLISLYYFKNLEILYRCKDHINFAFSGCGAEALTDMDTFKIE